ncbi:NAD(P)H-binding protein [Mucilaginibacter sp. McL0603]|uniref:NAD(P)H-binding protein n=1 Tax=Mucilaginibacter sp. McL0603 TaxID=3415670 RepID=UPI003CE7D0FA
MKIILTGSLGHISLPLTKELVQKGHQVTVVSSKPEKQAAIEALGATAAIGVMEDADFLTATFIGADAVYTMIVAGNYSDPNFDLMAEGHKLAYNYLQAIQRSGVKRVVHLSSIGAHMEKGNGILASYHNVEQILGTLPPDVAITFMRPVGFYYNLYAFIPVIKMQGVIASNYGGNDKEPWVSPIDIAAAVAEEIVKPFEGRKIRYVASDELTGNEVAGILGAAIGKPDLKWIIIPDEQVLNGMIAAGMNPTIAAGLVEMNASRRTVLYEDYYRNQPVLGKVKMTDFAKEFAAVYNQN